MTNPAGIQMPSEAEYNTAIKTLSDMTALIIMSSGGDPCAWMADLIAETKAMPLNSGCDGARVFGMILALMAKGVSDALQNEGLKHDPR